MFRAHLGLSSANPASYLAEGLRDRIFFFNLLLGFVISCRTQVGSNNVKIQSLFFSCQNRALTNLRH